MKTRIQSKEVKIAANHDSFLATGDFEQMSSNIARKELKCHTGLLKVGVHQNGAQELGIIVR